MRDYRREAQSLGDLLNYASLLDEGVLLLKDGALCRGWRYTGLDLYTATPAQVNALCERINQVFSQLGDGWVLHADLIRKSVTGYLNSPSQQFSNASSLFLDQERRDFFLTDQQHFISDYYWVVTYKSALLHAKAFQRFFIQTLTEQASTAHCWQTLLDEFSQKIVPLENALTHSLQLKPLTSSQLLTHLHTCLTGLTHPIQYEEGAIFIDQYLSTQDFRGGMTPQIGDQAIYILAIQGFPLTSQAMLLSHLAELPLPFRWSNRYLFLDAQSSEQWIKKCRRYWFQKHHGLWGLLRGLFSSSESVFVDQDALTMTADADAALLATQSGQTRFGFYTSTLVFMDEIAQAKRLKDRVQVVSKTLQAKGFITRIETINAVEAYIGSLPGHGYQNVRKPMLSTKNLAHLLPLMAVSPSSDQHPCPYYPAQSPALFLACTQGHTPVAVHLHVGDVGHTLVIGDTGSGKSTLLGFLVAQHLRYPQAQVFVFDKGYSCFTLCHALAGNHYDLANDTDQLAFAPLKDIALPQELDWACEWLETLFVSQGVGVTAHQRQVIRDSLQRLAQQPSKTLSDLQVSLQDITLKQALEFYTLSGAMGTLLDATTDSLSFAPLQVFEMQQLFDKEDKFVLPLLIYLFRQINRRLAVNKPTLIIIEEGHRFLKGYFGEQLDIWLRECRKQNAAVVFVTQSLTDILTSPYQAILLGSCQSKFFLPNPAANAPLHQNLYQQIGLTASQITLIANATAKQDYYLASAQGNRFLNLKLSNAFLALMPANDLRTRQHILALKAQYQEQWVYHYFLEKGLPAVAEQWLLAYHTFTKAKADEHV